MANYNKVILMGNLTRDPELRYIPSGTAVADMSLAVNETYKNKAGEQVENTCFVDIVAWARQAEICNEYLSKGSPVLVEGRLQLDKWTSKEGESRSKLRVRADRVQFLGSGAKDSGGQADDAPAAPAQNDADSKPSGAPEDEPDLINVEDDDNLPF